MDLAEEFHAKFAYFQERFPQPEYEIAVSVFHSLYHGVSYLYTIDRALEGGGFGDEVESCSFPFSEDIVDEPVPYYGVKFTHDFTWGEPNSNEYWESIVPFDVFLDMLRASAQWHLRKAPQDEAQLLHYFHARNLALRADGSDFLLQDDGETWWRKCDEKRILHRSLRGMAQVVTDPLLWTIDDVFVYLPEYEMLPFLRAVTRRQNYPSCLGRQLEDMLDQNYTFFSGAQIDFSAPDEVQFFELIYEQPAGLRQEKRIAVSRQTFDAMLQAVASAYAKRRPQHARKVAALMRKRIK